MYYIALVTIAAIGILPNSPTSDSNSLYVANHPTQDSLTKIGKTVFYTHCSSCHKDSSVNLAPGYSILTTMTPRSIYAALNTGKMRAQAASLSETERKAVAQWLTGSAIKTTTLPEAAYTKFTMPAATTPYDHSGWGNNAAGTGFRSGEQAGINRHNISTLTLKWAFAFPDATVMRTKPAVVGNWLLVGGQYGEVFALDRNTGKIGWQFMADAAVRGAITVVRNGASVWAYFADFSTNVYALDVKTGNLVWKQRVGLDPQSAITGSVAVYNGMVYVPVSSIEVATAFNGNYPCCTSSGGLVAMDANTGRLLWIHRVLPRAVLTGKTKRGKPIYSPSGAPVWSSPTIDAKRGLVFIGTGENYSRPSTTTSDAIQALDLKTGALKWNFQGTTQDAYNLACPVMENCPDSTGPDFDFGMAPMLVKRKDGKDILVVGQKSGEVYALQPGSGALLWKTRIGRGGMLGGIHWGMACDGQYAYAANADNIYAINKRDTSFPVSPGMYALDLFTGKVAWKTASPDCAGKPGCIVGNSAAPVASPGMVWAGGLDGVIRAYDTGSGHIIWEYDTFKNFDAVNSIKAHGGSIDGPAPVLSNGMLFVNSGYGMFGQLSGNVLLAFSVNK